LSETWAELTMGGGGHVTV